MIQTIDGLALGGELTDVDIARLGLSHVSPGGETLPHWSDQDGLFVKGASKPLRCEVKVIGRRRAENVELLTEHIVERLTGRRHRGVS